MVALSGKSGIQVSREIGRSDNYLWSMLRNKTMPGLDLFVSIANACGYTVELHGPLEMETWELYTEDGKLVADLTQSVEDLETLSQMGADARAALMDAGRTELIDSLMSYLEGLKAQQQ